MTTPSRQCSIWRSSRSRKSFPRRVAEGITEGFHDLRHTVATLALQNGVEIKTVSGMLGHFSAGFTLDTYAHVTTSAQKEAAQTMGNVLNMKN